MRQMKGSLTEMMGHRKMRQVKEYQSTIVIYD
jgi:hypothetical protein